MPLAAPLDVSHPRPRQSFILFSYDLWPLATGLHPSEGCWWESPAAVAALQMLEGCRRGRRDRAPT